MPVTKFSVLFNGTAADGDQPYGFSETWYSNAGFEGAIDAFRRNCVQPRALLLPSGCKVYGYRVSADTTGARSVTMLEPNSYAGPDRNGPPNIPADAALCKVYGTQNSAIKRFWVHCLPDSFVQNALFVPEKDVQSSIRLFLNRMQTAGFLFRYQDPTAPQAPVSTIDVNGQVQLIAGLGPLAIPGATVQLLKVVNQNSETVTGKYKVGITGYVDPTNFRLTDYSGGAVVARGSVRLVVHAYTPFKAIPATGLFADPTIRPGARKLGRPFGLLRGRASKRR